MNFGKGFYTTIDKNQTLRWAARAGDGGDVLEFRVLKSKLSSLKQLNMSNKTKASLGRFFRHNRLGGRLHDYDIVSGPMLGNRSFLEGDELEIFRQQTSFHTQEAIDLLFKGIVK